MKFTQNQIVVAGAIAAIVIVSVAYFAYDPGLSLQYPKDAAANGAERKIDALTEALDKGKITAVQYRAQVAALAQAPTAQGNVRNAPVNAAIAADKTAAAKFDALNSALDSGLITQDEYNAKVAALTAGRQPAPASGRNPAGGKNCVTTVQGTNTSTICQ